MQILIESSISIIERFTHFPSKLISNLEIPNKTLFQSKLSFNLNTSPSKHPYKISISNNPR